MRPARREPPASAPPRRAAIGIDLDYVDPQSQQYQRFIAWVDAARDEEVGALAQGAQQTRGGPPLRDLGDEYDTSRPSRSS